MMKHLFLLIAFCSSTFVYFAQQNVTYQVPPKEIFDLANAVRPPFKLVTSDNKFIIFLGRPVYKTLEELAGEELKLAGLRVNPDLFDNSRNSYFNSIAVTEIATGKSILLSGLPTKINMAYPTISYKNNWLAFCNVTSDGLELWALNIASGKAKQLSNANLNACYGSPIRWSFDDAYIYVKWKDDKGKLVMNKPLPTGPTIQESEGKKSAARTFQDMLKNKNDEYVYNYYATSSIHKISLSTGERKQVLASKNFVSVNLSPDSKYMLAYEITTPYSYTLPYNRFPYKINIYDTENGILVSNIVDKGLQDKVPITFNACEQGRRDVDWRSDKPSTIYWIEAQDEGDPKKTAENRDFVYQLDAPFKGDGKFLVSTKNRFRSIVWGNDQLAFASDYWFQTRNAKTYLINPSIENRSPEIITDRSSEDLYNDPGDFVRTKNEFGRMVLDMSKDKKKLYLKGEGFSPDGNKPFLDEWTISSKKSKRLWRADGKSTYESIESVLDMDKKLILTSIESPSQFPNLFIRNFSKDKDLKQITFVENPYKSFEGTSKQKIKYKREDGVDLDADLYLPKDYDKTKQGPLPMLIEAYPTEYKDASNAGQVNESPHRFVSFSWATPIYWAMRGYAVLEGAKFPIIGRDKEEPNDTYIPQLVANAKAAIKAVSDMGVVDPKRCAVMGHSYGAFMTANLLAHSDLFAAGIARSGAYNRTLTPFGFQSEERSYWEAQKVYQEMSPFNYADKIKGALLLIHGEADNNPGTFTLQSERLFQAVKGLGGKSRLVILPYESHSYAAKDNIMHMLWEMDTWLEKHVKNK
jgi:dipeptidyl aminopeptidase/acylaminoacyl peptidase